MLFIVKRGKSWIENVFLATIPHFTKRHWNHTHSLILSVVIYLYWLWHREFDPNPSSFNYALLQFFLFGDRSLYEYRQLSPIQPLKPWKSEMGSCIIIVWAMSVKKTIIKINWKGLSLNNICKFWERESLYTLLYIQVFLPSLSIHVSMKRRKNEKKKDSKEERLKKIQIQIQIQKK